jgi:putative DNA primase/helicase
MSAIGRQHNFSLRERTRGRWFGILSGLGVDARYLRNMHGPCPACGGKDRFRWDDRNGDGTFYCNQCGAGSGVDLVMRVKDLPFKEAATLIEQMIGETQAEPPQARERSEEKKRAALRSLWLASNPIRCGDPVDQWFRNRGIAISIYPACLRTAMQVRHSGPPESFHPAMLAVVSGPDGKPATIHKTYLTGEGTKALSSLCGCSAPATCRQAAP